MDKKVKKRLTWIFFIPALIYRLFGHPSTHEKSMSFSKSIQAGHEVSDVNAKGIAIFSFSLILGIVLIQLSLGAVLFTLRHQSLKSKHAVTLLPQAPRVPPPPHLQVNPARDLETYLRQENRLLHSYGWIDPQKKIARIPIQRAMKLISDQPNLFYQKRSDQ
jgi:hypothetical protein